MSELPPALSPRPAGQGATPEPPLPPRPAVAPSGTPPVAGSTARVQRAEAGLTAPGVAVIVLAGSLVGLLIDAFTLDSGTIFAIAFVASCAYAAVQVRRRDLLAAVVIPPLVFLLLVVGRAIIDPTSTTTLSARLLDVASELATQAPALWAGTAVAAVIVLVRWRRGRPSS